MASDCVIEGRNEPLEAPYQVEWGEAPRGGLTYIGQYQFSVNHIAGVTDVIFQVGRPLRWTDGTPWYYGIVTAYSAGTVYISGIAIVNINSLDFLEFGPMSKVTMMTFSINGQYADGADQQLIFNNLNTLVRWSMGTAYCVQILHIGIYPDTGASQPRINAYRSVYPGAQVPIGLGNLSEGLDVVQTWTSTCSIGSSGMNPSNYMISNGDRIDIGGNAQGANDDARDLTVVLVFVYE